MNDDVIPTQTITGQKVLLMGDPGTGKTYSLSLAALQSNRPLCILMTEDGLATLQMDPILSPLLGRQIFVAFRPPVPGDFSNLADQFDLLNRMDVDNLSKMAPAKDANSYFGLIAREAREFTCDISGRKFVNSNKWPAEMLFGLDGLSGLAEAAKRMVVGNRMQLGLNHYGIAMRSMEAFLNAFTLGHKCGRIATAHEEREINENTGESRIYPSTLGKKLAPVVGRYFDQVIQTINTMEGFTWRTLSNQAALKTRGLPRKPSIPIDWLPIFPRLSDARRDEVLEEVTKK